jgi:hypothetical protein
VFFFVKLNLWRGVLIFDCRLEWVFTVYSSVKDREGIING